MPYIAYLIIAVILLIPGIPMAIVPFPGLLYMLIVAVGFGLLDNFMHLNGSDIAILSALAAITLLVDLISGVMGAKWSGASWASIFWGLVGLIIGGVVIPIPIIGSLAGMFIGTLASEWFRTKDVRQANKAAVGGFLGWLAGTGFKAVAAVVFLILFVVLAIN